MVFRYYHIYSVTQPVKRLHDAQQLPHTHFPGVYAMIYMSITFCYYLFQIIIFIKKAKAREFKKLISTHRSKADLVSTMVGYTKAKTHNFSILQTNVHSYKEFRILQMRTTNTISFSILVIALHVNNLRMFLTNVVIAGAACLSAFLIFASFTKIVSSFFALVAWFLVAAVIFLLL